MSKSKLRIRCKLSQEGKENVEENKDRKGFVIGTTHDLAKFKVIWDGEKKIHTYLKGEIEKVD